jgi:hypothetical protein
MEGVPAHRPQQVPGPQLVKGVALARVPLAHIVPQRPDVAMVAPDQGFEGTPGADGVELAKIAHDDGPCPGGFHGAEELGHVGIRGHAGFVQEHNVAGGQPVTAVIEAPGERGHRARTDPGPLLQSFGRLPRGGGPDHGITRCLEPGPYGRKSRGFPAAGHANKKVQAMPGG